MVEKKPKIEYLIKYKYSSNGYLIEESIYNQNGKNLLNYYIDYILI